MSEPPRATTEPQVTMLDPDVTMPKPDITMLDPDMTTLDPDNGFAHAVSGSNGALSGSGVGVSGSSVRVSGSSVGVSGSGVGVSGSSVGVSGSSVRRSGSGNGATGFTVSARHSAERTDDVSTPSWWAAEAAALSSAQYKQRAPLHVVLDEAVGVARFASRYAQTRTIDGVTTFGLDSALTLPVVTKLADEIGALVAAVGEANTRYLATLRPRRSGLVRARAHAVRDDLIAALVWQRRGDDHARAELDQLRARHADDDHSDDALSLQLEDLAALAAPNRAALHGLGGFDAQAIDEALHLARTLRAIPGKSRVVSDESKALLDERNRLLQLLELRVAQIRTAARFVFRRQPEIIREVTSAFERRRRASTRARRSGGKPTTVS